MKKLALLTLSVVSLGWLGNFHFNEANSQRVAYKEWVHIPIIITSAIMGILLEVIAILMWIFFLESNTAKESLLYLGIGLILFIIGASLFLIREKRIDLKQDIVTMGRN